ncbi:TAXI family TRAP transporter solute-binding subunit [Pontibacillus yanchengensis]|uniref:TAXI family TRAP transporter solute-binding subunit n=2 Tax=Pontibacillus yanchengensis TaxID=462910 RepID=A0ACC7VDL1_9BACI|nr:TAXI family TRAP transporter solute-binding subunit [Pontibacillus yanchengensis]MYL32197.1 TAXI family TRAP transporter solute-binding subunit [Pontibacillus yanchengensis]MYL52777.1 TAXI family TRAP transporter solute-binding subunit [Pontibacillus yanchengensis]
MKQRRFLGLLFVIALSLVLAACGGGTADGGNEGNGGESGEGDSGGKQFVSMLTGGNQGTYYPLGGTFAKVINDNLENVEANATSSGASVENMKKIADGDGQVAFVQTDIAAYAAEGKLMFEGNKIENVQAMGSLYPETIQIVTTKESGIESVEDLKGKTVSIGAPGSGTRANAENILDIHGLSTDDIDAQNLDFGESTSGIQDGSIDAAFITSGTPTGAVEGLAATTDVTIVPIKEGKINELKEKFPYYAKDTVKEGTYGLKSDVTTVAVQAMLVTRKDLGEDVVYNMTKAIFENTDAISHTKGEFISAESALEGVGIDLHPGAKKYFDEKGISK